KGEFGSRLDRHAPLGKGLLGWDTFHALASDRRTENIPLITETPDEEAWPVEIATLLSNFTS
ncbi:MAG: deoxyribonuclease IV, partial [Kiritimatiellaeota bacterium]|nr:deoxyribonuclease IV [Kiritimatiellota bacterium]